MGAPRRHHALAALLLVACIVSACDEPVGGDRYEWGRADEDYGTVGEELFAIWRKDAERAPEKPEARVRMLDAHKSEFIDSVDQVVPPDEMERTDEFLQTTNPSIESGLLPGLTRKIRISMAGAASDDDLLDAFAAGRGPSVDSYLAADARPNLMVRALEYEEARPTTRMLTDTLLAADGVDAEGERAEGEDTIFADFQRTAARRLREIPAERTPPATDLRDILLREDGRFQPSRDATVGIVQFDRRGTPVVADGPPPGPQGPPIGPFADRDGDGLADLDDRGRFVLRGGDNRHIAPFDDEEVGPIERDDRGRATFGGSFVFEYRNLAHTGLHWSTRQFDRLHKRDVHWQLLDGAPALLGQRIEHDLDEDDGTYLGYSSDLPAVDLLHVLFDLVNFEELPSSLRGAARLVDGQSGALARLVDAFGEVRDEIASVPDAELENDPTLRYDLLPIIEDTAADPALWEDVFDSFTDPVFARTGEAMKTMLKFKDRDSVPKEGGSYDQCFKQCRSKYKPKETAEHPHGIGLVGRFECIRNCPNGDVFDKQTAFDQPETRDNRSQHQQLFHLLRDARLAPYKMTIESIKVGGVNLGSLPPIMELPGAAEAFVRTIAGNLRLKNYVSDELLNDPIWGTLINLLGISKSNIGAVVSFLSQLTGTKIDRNPTPSQITRLFNQPDLKIEVLGTTVDVSDPRCNDGYIYANHHGDKLFSASAAGVFDALQPISKAFSDHDREEVFTAFFDVIHEHYSTHETYYETEDGSPSPMKGSNLVSLEPALFEIAKSGEIFRAVHEFAKAVDRMKPIDGEPFVERLRQFVYHALRSTDEFGNTVEGPNGETDLTLPDGDTVTTPSRLHYALAAVDRLIDQVDGQPDRRRKLESAWETLTDIFLSTSPGQAEDSDAFDNEGALALTSLGLRQFAETAERWQQNGSFEKTLDEDAPETVRDVVEARSLPVFIDFADYLAANSERRNQLDGWMRHILGDEAGRNDIAAAGYKFLASQGEPGRAAAGDALGRIVDPDREWETDERTTLPVLSHILTVVDRIVERDSPGTGFDLLRRGVTRRGDGQKALGSIGEVIADYYRRKPDAEAPYESADYRLVFRELADWLGDDEHGLEQIYDIIGRRTSDDGDN